MVFSSCRTTFQRSEGQPFDIAAVQRTIAGRDAAGRRFTIIAVAEGASPASGSAIYEMSAGRRRYGGIAFWLAEELARTTEQAMSHHATNTATVQSRVMVAAIS